jgi:hypothetical protein
MIQASFDAPRAGSLAQPLLRMKAWFACALAGAVLPCRPARPPRKPRPAPPAPA